MRNPHFQTHNVVCDKGRVCDNCTTYLRCSELVRSSAPPLTGRRTAPQCSPPMTCVLHPKCTKDAEWNHLFSHQGLKPQFQKTTSFKSDFRLFLVWSEKKLHLWTTPFWAPTPFFKTLMKTLDVLNIYYWPSRVKKKSLVCWQRLTKKKTSALLASSGLLPVIPHHVPACQVMLWWCSCGWLGLPLTQPPGWQTLRLEA